MYTKSPSTLGVIAHGLAAFFMLVVSITTSAQERPCIPDCPETPFGPNQRVVLTLPSGCVVRVTYASRIPECFVPPYYDVAIVQIEYLNALCSGPLLSMLEAVTRQLLLANPMYFPMPTTGCLSRFRVTRSVCWRIDSVLDCDGDTLVVPCDSSGCCLSQYRICRDSSGVVSVTKISSSVPVGADTCLGDSIECVNTCFGTSEMRATPTSIHEDVANSSSKILSIRPNPAGNVLYVMPPGHLQGPWHLRIASVAGVVVFEQRGASRDQHDEIAVDVGRLTPGAYSVSFEHHGAVQRSNFIKR